ncbi:hypothetical protein, conserved [Eimeria maxima]|uniref:Phenylalanyl-tRNA synthetase domain-containing protein n=1 Tax=Eimeria maxima TaxID=5804 RepID=U6LZQ6_EIMMA|nr:hypothetical protein, conserved [Eimeria maxima]CDJ56333.1 hypothetical protein, conserved [Eimeria maxima]
MEVLRIMPPGEDAEKDLKRVVGDLLTNLMPKRKWRLLKDEFPFTNPSIQAEVMDDDGRYLEVLGGGVLLPSIVSSAMPPPPAAAGGAAAGAAGATAAANPPSVWALGKHEEGLLTLLRGGGGPLPAAEINITDKFYNNRLNKYSITLRFLFKPPPSVSDPAVFSNLTQQQMQFLSTAVCETFPTEVTWVVWEEEAILLLQPTAYTQAEQH